MNRQERHTKEKPMKGPGKTTRSRFDNEISSDQVDRILFDKIGTSIKGYLDIEDVKNDPALSATREAVRGMMSDYSKNLSANRENERFIKNIIAEEKPVYKISDELKYIRQEIDEKKLSLITSEWVKEWHEKKQRIGEKDPKSEEIRNFITEALNSPIAEPVNPGIDGPKKSYSRSLFVRYISLTAAALIGVFILIRTLLPSSNPETLFNAYYKPFDAVSPVTRSINNNESDIFSSAINSYKTGDYQGAAAGFDVVLSEEPLSGQTRFLLGLSHLALANYNPAISELSDVANAAGEYGKEAKWYLGLSYLRTGNAPKARECFESLVKSDGFYRERSEKILRRLR
jgi:tetratricopeptide (TPR) repeat protein